MGHTIVGSLLPVVVTLLLGFVAARRHDFSKQHAAILNRLALRYALPLMLFVGTVNTSRAELREGMPLLLAPFVPFMGPATLGSPFGRAGGIPTATGSLVINLTVVPATVLFLTMDPQQ